MGLRQMKAMGHSLYGIPGSISGPHLQYVMPQYLANGLTDDQVYQSCLRYDTDSTSLCTHCGGRLKILD